MTEETEREITAIEETQAALRDSIERTKTLADQADTLIKRHKKTLKGQKPLKGDRS